MQHSPLNNHVVLETDKDAFHRHGEAALTTSLMPAPSQRLTNEGRSQRKQKKHKKTPTPSPEPIARTRSSNANKIPQVQTSPSNRQGRIPARVSNQSIDSSRRPRCSSSSSSTRSSERAGHRCGSRWRASTRRQNRKIDAQSLPVPNTARIPVAAESEPELPSRLAIQTLKTIHLTPEHRLIDIAKRRRGKQKRCGNLKPRAGSKANVHLSHSTITLHARAAREKGIAKPSTLKYGMFKQRPGEPAWPCGYPEALIALLHVLWRGLVRIMSVPSAIGVLRSELCKACRLRRSAPHPPVFPTSRPVLCKCRPDRPGPVPSELMKIEERRCVFLR